MPSTHLSLHYHLIFSTKDHVALMHKDWRGRLHAYMGGIVNDLGGVPETIGGVEDHVHLLIGLRATHRLADVLKEIKSLVSAGPAPHPGRDDLTIVSPVVSPPANIRCPSGTKQSD